MILEVLGLSFSYGRMQVLRDVSFDLEEHSITAVMGPNGSGKTTLLRCLNGILEPDDGTVQLLGTETEGYSRRGLARRIAYVPQRSEAGRVTAFDAVLIGRRPHMAWRVTAEDVRLTEAALRLLGLQPLALRHTDEMSGGEHQKVCLARAIVQQPALMLLDEPTASLDLHNQLEILGLLRRIVKGHRMSAVVTMHDLNTAFRYADRFLFLRDGGIHADVDREGITPQIVEEVYEVPVELLWHRDHPVVLPDDGIGTASGLGSGKEKER
jgi:iron complex transport system ATP-binding protein